MLFAVTVAAAVGWIPWRDLGFTVVLLSFGHAAVSCVAVLLRGAATGAPGETALVPLLLVAPLDFVVVRLRCGLRQRLPASGHFSRARSRQDSLA